ncbi:MULTISPECIES: DUF3077 domain-containing protein [unclassified Pseudomonas]|uniref:DUF3077 domain-containing protein n=1 Tax=unclassified Pseudomonas TaxID=196821 RepID=UPI0024496841|nr:MULTISPECIES: DUF3077 domain-containing protein [unclassified Pseudomonas]MDH0304668.1 DUF3077 domain-containing protein [Pseudomonas sp. GD04091]MDH1987771.1 DUF3077 domain-containing protein [Pseudomonas sp. GD03689]
MTCGQTAGRMVCLDLFKVEPGIAFEDAFSELSVLLGCIRHLTCEAEMEVGLNRKNS